MSEEIRRLTYRDDDLTIKLRWHITEDDDQDYILACEVSRLIEKLPICRRCEFLAEVTGQVLNDTDPEDDGTDGHVAAFLSAARVLKEWWQQKDEELRRRIAQSNEQPDGD